MMRQVRGVAAALALLLLAGCGGDPAEETPAVSGTEPPAGEITLYGEIHGNAAIKEYEAERWKECYDQGMRHLFVELPCYTAQWLNLWMDAEDDGILEQLHQDWEGTYASGAETLDFYRTVKEGCPETVFHGTDVGHQYDSTGARYRDYLEERGPHRPGRHGGLRGKRPLHGRPADRAVRGRPPHRGHLLDGLGAPGDGHPHRGGEGVPGVLLRGGGYLRLERGLPVPGLLAAGGGL